jgi:hypothetical protein
MSLYINFVDAFLDTEFPNLTSEERDVLRAVVTHDLYTSEQIRGMLRARAQAVLDILRQDQGSGDDGTSAEPPQHP